jgi:transposase-like protein
MAVDLERMAALHAQGLSARDIASILGCTCRAVQRWRTRTGHNVRPAPGRHPASVRQQAGMLLEDGCSLAEAARTLGVDAKTVARWFPDAHRMTQTERGEWAAYCKKNGKVLAGAS